MPDRQTLPYRDCVGIAVFNAGGEVLIGRRMPEGDPEDSSVFGSPWQMPQGGIDKGESPLEAAQRELYEETSIRSARLLDEAPDWIYYDLPEAALGIALRGRYRGQRQRWFALAFIGEESEIDVTAPGGGAFKAEFDQWRWAPLESLPELVVPFKRTAYDQVVAAFGHLPAKLRGDGATA